MNAERLQDADDAPLATLPIETPEDAATRAILDGRARRRRVVAVIVGTVLGHAALFAGLASLTPKAAPPPREVEVMRFEAVVTPGGSAVEWQGEGGRRVARIRPDPAMYAR